MRVPTAPTAASRTRRGAVLRKLLISAAALLVFAVLLEIGARIWLVRFAPDDVFFDYASVGQLETSNRPPPGGMGHPYMGYAPVPGLVRGADRTNSLGFRGDEIAQPKPASEFRIVCLGGSTTFTTCEKDYTLSYPAQLERWLRAQASDRIRVVNAGVAGFGSWETLVNFEFRVLDLDPDLVIVYHGVNDILPRLVWPPEAYRGDNTGFRAAPRHLIWPSLAEHSTVLRMLLVRTGRVLPHSQLDRNFFAHADTYRGLRPHPDLPPVAPEQMLDANPPIYFERNLENLAVMARHRGIVPVFVSFAHTTRFEDDPLPQYRVFFARAYPEMNAALKDAADQGGAVFMDLAKDFPEDVELWCDAVHLNADGARLKAERIGAFLLEQQLVPPREGG